MFNWEQSFFSTFFTRETDDSQQVEQIERASHLPTEQPLSSAKSQENKPHYPLDSKLVAYKKRKKVIQTLLQKVRVPVSTS